MFFYWNISDYIVVPKIETICIRSFTSFCPNEYPTFTCLWIHFHVEISTLQYNLATLQMLSKGFLLWFAIKPIYIPTDCCKPLSFCPCHSNLFPIIFQCCKKCHSFNLHNHMINTFENAITCIKISIHSMELMIFCTNVNNKNWVIKPID